MSKPILSDRARRGIIAVGFSIFYWRLPQIMPLFWKGIVVFLVCFFFVALPVLKGLQGGAVAGFFSLVFAGLGHLYVRSYARAFIFIFGAVFAYMTSGYSSKAVIFNMLLFIVAAFDAFSLGKRGIGIF